MQTNKVLLFVLACSFCFSALFALGDPSGNVLYAEHFAQVRAIIGGGVDGPAKQSVIQAGIYNFITSDTSGNYYFVSQNTSKIYWMNKAGVIQYIAGTGMSGFRDGPGDEATFCFGDGQYPTTQIHCDQNGNIYVADLGNSRLRKIFRNSDSTWQVITVAGGGAQRPTKGGWISADKLDYVAPNFGLFQDGSAAIWSSWSGIYLVKLTGTASENQVTLLATADEVVAQTNTPCGSRSWKSGAFVTYDSLFYWMPADPAKVLCYNIKTGEMFTYAGSCTHVPLFDGTDRIDARFHTVTLSCSKSGKVMFTGGGDEADLRRIYQDTVKHLLVNGTFNRQNNSTNSWYGMSNHIDANGFFFSVPYANGTYGVLITRMTFEGSDTTPGHVRTAGLSLRVVDSITGAVVSMPTVMELVQSSNVIRRQEEKTGQLTLYEASGTYTLNIKAAGYRQITGLPLTLTAGQATTLTVPCTRLPLVRLEFSPDSIVLSTNSEEQAPLFGVYSDSARLLLDSGLTVTWTSRAPALVSVTAGGLLRSASQEGAAFVIASMVSPALSDSIKVICQDPKPLFHWPLDEGTGTQLTDASGHGNTGTLHGTSSWVTGQSGSALSLNGTDNFISTTTSLSAPNEFTLSLWFKTSTATAGTLIGIANSQNSASSNYDRDISITAAGKLTFFVYDGGHQEIATTASYNDGSWHHVAAVLSAEGLALYVDGALAISRTDVTRGEITTGYWKIGCNNPLPCFNGMLDDIRVYDFALSASAINALAGSPVSNLEQQLIWTQIPLLSVSPNPFGTSVCFKAAGFKSDAQWRLFDVTGRLVADFSSVLNNAESRTAQINWRPNTVASGVYILMLKSGRSVVQKKILCTH